MSDSLDEAQSKYRVSEEERKRFPHSYYVTPLRSPPTGPELEPAQRRYFYLDVAPPSSVPTRVTLLLLHGFPDSSYGWRNVLSPLSLSGYRCIVPDLVGYGQTSRPGRIEEYGAHSQALDLAGLMDHAMGEKGAKFAVVGHDWGSWLSWKLLNFIPERLLGVHGICIPYAAPSSKYVSIEELGKMLPMYGYQSFFSDPNSSALIQKNLDAFLYRIYAEPKLVKSQPGLNKKMGFVKEGILQSTLKESNEDVKELSRASSLSPTEFNVLHQLFDEKMGGDIHAPLNWYRARKVNFEENKVLTTKMLPPLPYKILVPELDVTAPMFLAEGARRFMPAGASYTVEPIKNCGHWVLIEYPEIASQSITRWIEDEVLPRQATILQRIRAKL